ncbi:chromosome partitioning protein [Cryptosporangium sp. NPDC048952]|uniref:AAA family ATPase n=1 Tax=Cryptosporangium sp. NPDC048952 TaxID=3363961 RepID=UPI00371BFB5C
MTLPVLTVVTDGADWELALVAAWGDRGAGVTVVRRCTGAAELLAMASTGVAVAAVLPADLAYLDRPLLSRLASAGVAVVGIVAPADEPSRDRLRALGVGHVLPSDASPSAVAGALRAATAALTTHRASPRPSALRGTPPPSAAGERAQSADAESVAGGGVHRAPTAEEHLRTGPGRWPTRAGTPTSPSIVRSRLAGRGATPPDPPTDPDPPRVSAAPPDTSAPRDLSTTPTGRGREPGEGPGELAVERREGGGSAPGRVIAVWGPTGAPGRTTVAVGLADEIARLGVNTLLVDADPYGGVIAQLLGLLDEASGLASAARLADTGRLTPKILADLSRAITPNLRVLTGLSRAERWPEVRPEAMATILENARALCPLTIVDCGFCLEQDEELVYDTAAPRRNGATLTSVETADTVLAIGAADPIGLQRLIRGLADLKEFAEPDIVVNQVRRGPVPGDPTHQIATALERFAGVHGIRTLPYDRQALDRALAEGRTLGEVADKSRLRRALTELATSVSVQFGLRGSTNE